MSRQSLVVPFPWEGYSKKLVGKILRPRSVGAFSEEEARQRRMRFICGREGGLSEGNLVALYWLVDPDDGIIVDARFQVYGQSALIGAAEAACELLIGKNYLQARTVVGADFIDRQLRDKETIPAFPRETYPHLNLVVGAIDDASSQCGDIPVSTAFVSPVPSEVGGGLAGGHPDWGKFTLKEKLHLINQVLDEFVRPYISLDDGGIEVLNLLNDRELVIAYQGNCNGCFSATGATLYYIQQTLQAKVHPDLVVVPDMPEM